MLCARVKLNFVVMQAENMPDHGGNRIYDLRNAKPILRSVLLCDNITPRYK